MIKGAVSRVTLVKLTYLLGLACCICVSGQTFRTQKLFRDGVSGSLCVGQHRCNGKASRMSGIMSI